MAITIVGDLIDNCHAKVIHCAYIAQIFRATAATFAKMKIITSDDMRNTKAIDEVLKDEFICFEVCQFFVKCNCRREVCAQSRSKSHFQGMRRWPFGP